MLRSRLSPNAITWLSLFSGLLGGVFFALGTYGWGIAGGIALVLAYTLDNCDGEVARLTNTSSAFGAKLDDVADWLIDSFFFLALGYGTWISQGDFVWFAFGLAAAAGASIDYLVDLYKDRQQTTDDNEASKLREEQARNPKQAEGFVDWLIYVFHKLSRADFCVIVLTLAVFGVTWVLLPLAAIGAQAYWIADLFSRVRGWHT
jgi:phosphatidylglycerophosphate synthase